MHCLSLISRGLEDQLLGIVVAEERPDLEEAKNALIINSAKMKQELKQIEDNILSRLSDTEGNPVDDVDLINALQASKAKSQEIQVNFFIFFFLFYETFMLNAKDTHIATAYVTAYPK